MSNTIFTLFLIFVSLILYNCNNGNSNQKPSDSSNQKPNDNGLLAQTATRLTFERAKLLTVGMTISQVNAIIGKPARHSIGNASSYAASTGLNVNVLPQNNALYCNGRLALQVSFDTNSQTIIQWIFYELTTVNGNFLCHPYR